MNFDIDMNATGATSLGGMVSGGLGAASSQPQPQQQFNQQPQQSFQQAQPQQFNQQPQQQQWQPQPQQQQSFQQHQQSFQQAQPQQFNQQPSQPKVRPQGNGVILKKGQKFTLAGAGSQLSTIKVCLGWDVLNQACDLDVSAFMLDANNRVIGDDWFVFYGQTTSPDGSVQHSGDSQGAGAGDDEIITINLNSVNANVQKIAFVITIDEALQKGLNFSMVANAYVRVVDASNNNEISKFSLTDYYSNVTSMVVGEVYRRNGEWKFNAVGDGKAVDLAGLCQMYGVNVAG